ncbi:gliding motility lipoprotein GldB [Marinifilum flexuosum]|uniref:gliding motility lipoprotein GldB n=1 Tax=Marinifilum flexuosum TaxID=1117708 RepID=UPI0024940818|nr:gliding motility lipoprotein GldB [Marinifilum flexuosum]
MQHIQRISTLLLCMMILFSCNSKKAPNVSHISVDLKIKRFDKDLFVLKETQDFAQFKTEYSDFLSLFSYKVIGLGNPDDPNYMDYLNKFLEDSTMNVVAQKVAEVFPDLSKDEKELEQAFKYLKYYFPKRKVPDVYAQISGFNQSVVVAEDLIGISLDKYLGEDCEFYSLLATPMYARKNMVPERVSQDVILAYGLTEFPFKPKSDDLISNMIYQGKIRYFLMQLMPEKSEVDAMKYTQEQLDWCKESEDLIWGYIIEQKHLFNTEYRTIIKYINDGPFTPGMPQDSPSKTGIWVGLQIVKEFMEKNKEYTLSDLMQENDYGMILRNSSYQP